MKKEISENLKLYRILSIIILLIGIVLMTFMIIMENEPGGLPLLLTFIGGVWLTVNQLKIKKSYS